MKKKAYFFASLLAVGSLTLVGCKAKDKDDDKAMGLALAAISVSMNAAGAKEASKVRGGVSAAASSVSSSASSGSVAFRLKGVPADRNQLMAAVLKETAAKRLERVTRTQVLPTTLNNDADNGTCNATGCNATLNGTANCSSGGTFEAINLKVGFSFPASNSYSGTLKGGIKMNKCVATTQDWFNFPSLVASTTTGSITIDGSTTFTIVAITGSTMDLIYKEAYKVTSSDLSVNGGAALAVDMTTAVDLKVKSTSSNVVTNSTSTTFSFSATYSDILTGAASVAGTVGGSPANVSRVFNGETFNYNVACTIDMNTGAGDCVIK